MQVPFDATFDEVVRAVCDKYKTSGLTIKYTDETGRKTVMSNDDDLAEALDLSPNPNRLEVWCFQS